MSPVAGATGVIASLVELVESGVPVLRATAADLAKLERDPERVSGAALATVILRDPPMTLRVLRFLQSHRTRSQTQDITTIAHAIMMLGHARFFREFQALPVIEDAVGGTGERLHAIRTEMSCARLAALLARDWAVQRHDMDPEEVMVGALMHDITELLALLRFPEGAAVLGGDVHAEVRNGLFARLGLPGLIAELTDDAAAGQPRVANVRLACRLARDLMLDWYHPRVADDLADVQRLLRISAVEIWERVRRVALQAAREWRFYDVVPAASNLARIPETDALAAP